MVLPEMFYSISKRDTWDRIKRNVEVAFYNGMYIYGYLIEGVDLIQLIVYPSNTYTPIIFHESTECTNTIGYRKAVYSEWPSREQEYEKYQYNLGHCVVIRAVYCICNGTWVFWQSPISFIARYSIDKTSHFHIFSIVNIVRRLFIVLLKRSPFTCSLDLSFLTSSFFI